MKKLFGLRGAGHDADARRERQREAWRNALRELDALLPAGGAFQPWMTEAEMTLAREGAATSRVTALVQDTIRRRHMAALVTLADWQPEDGTDVLLLTAGRVKELVDLSATIAEAIGSQVSK